ncbi:MAG: TrpR-like protein, YerC/YecD [Oscillospiraceae bacterium]|nr:TrpR-like protein, YerC/YecD [Oscillospiraceae bacterium]
MFKPMDKAHLKDLYEAFAVLKSADEIEMFMQDLCTPQELVAIAQRYQIAKLLSENRRYAEIVEETGTSTATISRVNRSLSMVSSGGYAIVFDRLKKQKDSAK